MSNILSLKNSTKPYVVTVFGASGDLVKKKTLPCLWFLYRDSLIPRNIKIIGYARSDLTIDLWRQRFEKNCRVAENQKEKFEEFISKLYYFRGQYDSKENFQVLKKHIDDYSNKYSEETIRIFYLAVPPEIYVPITQHIYDVIYDKNRFIDRIILEKPFGCDLESFNRLSNHLNGLFSEKALYRIDHFLGKEMIQNLLVLRFSNLIFSPTWNKEFISSVTISLKEDFGITGRAGYFNEAGIIRDCIQNHLLQVLTLVAMDKPSNLDSDSIRTEKVKLLNCIKPIDMKDFIIGQYEGNPLSSNEDHKKGYLDEEGIPKDSLTSTYALIALYIDNDKWRGVPFFIRCGKGLNEKKCEIRIQYKDNDLFNYQRAPRNELVIKISPSEAIYMKFNFKEPKLDFSVKTTELDLTYSSRYPAHKIHDAYERLLLEVFLGSQYDFVRGDELAVAWKIFTPLLEYIDNNKIQPEKYVFGSRGPSSADSFLISRGFVYLGNYKWIN
uniref:Glucose-6-phosphate 1-dehydrogenase n=1 Tax=Parastrongyloides trichosuri TaxID=131310 RepID=A0A0N4ZFB8_PARTI